MIDESIKEHFRLRVWSYYQREGRHDLPWRSVEADGRLDVYKVLVSEVMLQQTQVSRVILKFNAFIAKYPTVALLAKASQGEVLRVWSGLGYNRRAKFLHQAAKTIVKRYGGTIPRSKAELIQLPGVGVNTAGAILAYGFNQPVVFIETNIRSVFIHHFFEVRNQVSDMAITQLLEQTLDRGKPREWYWALMDYGAMLKQQNTNPARRSKHHVIQSKFEGSRRQLRGQVLRTLSERSYTVKVLKTTITDERLSSVLDELQREKLIRLIGRSYTL